MDFNKFAQEVHDASCEAGWWPEEDKINPYVVPMKISLIHSEISEALEGFRKDEMDDKVPHRSSIEVEFADAIIRIGDLAAFLKLDVEGAIKEKLEVNKTRKDHKPEVRKAKGGKRF